MSFCRSHEDAHKYGTDATKVIDGELTTSPVRDGGSMDVGGAPIANAMGGTTEFTQSRTRTGIMDHPVGQNVRQYGQAHKVSPK
jgi:hypothetical protein